MFSKLKKLAFTAAVAAAMLPAVTAHAQDVEGDGKPWHDYYDALKGKKVAFVPMSLSFDLAQIYDGAMKQYADYMGFEYISRDPNWSVEGAVQIAEQYVDEHPDVMVIHPLDDKAFTRVVKKAQKEGIYVIFMNLRNGSGTDSMEGDAYIGPDFFQFGQRKVQLAADYCKDSESKKIIMVQAGATNSVGITETNGSLWELKHNHPELNLVAMQSAEADPAKAKAIVATALKQHPDVCAIIDQWEGGAIGIPPAVEEAGLRDKIKIITSGGGSQVNGCDMINAGKYDAYISYNAGHQTYMLKSLIAQVLQTKPVPGETQFSVYNDYVVITKDTMTANSCWDINYYTRPLK